jgi:hypothetical protein
MERLALAESQRMQSGGAGLMAVLPLLLRYGSKVGMDAPAAVAWADERITE